MVSQEFKSAVSTKNLLRARIMLKDSFVVDPTFEQLNEMLVYAKRMLPDIMVPFDGETLKDDPSKWNQDVMNMELVQLVNNFSEKRVDHLKEVVSKVMAEEIRKICAQRATQHTTQFANSHTPKAGQMTKSTASAAVSPEMKPILRRKALQQLKAEAKKINKILHEVEENGKWKSSDIDEMDKAARQILNSVQSYKDNR